ncbi:MAG: hypothetical protein RLZZ08_1614 [Pseudomonadota bacterium]|jgi:hypothetical protein
MLADRVALAEREDTVVGIWDCEDIDGYSFSHISAPRCRYVTLNDPSRAMRDAWMTCTFADFEQHAFVDGATSYLSVATSNFDALFIGGNDVRRMVKIIRGGSTMLSRRMKIALVSGANAQRRAQLISAGFDDVFDPEKTHMLEAQARVAAIWRRYTLRFEKERQESQNETLLSRICNPHKLTDREKRLLLMLMKSKDSFVSYNTIRREISDYYEEIGLDYLKVIVCLLRRKLVPGVRIVARTLQGYQLTY